MSSISTRTAPAGRRYAHQSPQLLSTIDTMVARHKAFPRMTATNLQAPRMSSDTPAVDTPPQPASDTARIAALEGRTADLEARVDRLENPAEAPPSDPPASAATAMIDSHAIYARMNGRTPQTASHVASVVDSSAIYARMRYERAARVKARATSLHSTTRSASR